jgi:hypothetical protein
VGGFNLVEVVEAERIVLVLQWVWGFPRWNSRGKKVEAAPTFAPRFFHSVGNEKS